MSNAEEWRPVVGYEGLYEVSELGRVRSLDRFYELPHPRNPNFTLRRVWRGRVLTPVPTGRNGAYRKVELYESEGVSRTRSVHRLVLEAFVGVREPDVQTRHLNGLGHDNRLRNLQYGTAVENAADKVRHGHHTRGEQSVRAKLTQRQVDAIRQSAESQRVLAVRYGVTQSNISFIKRGVTWTKAA